VDDRLHVISVYQAVCANVNRELVSQIEFRAPAFTFVG
jgi:hypothetical protein